MNTKKTKNLNRDNRIKDALQRVPTNDLPSLPIIPIVLTGGVKMSKVLTDADLKDIIKVSVDSAYASEHEIAEGYVDGNPHEAMDDVIAVLEHGLAKAKLLRGHRHQWIDQYGDGRDLSCTCAICGCQET